MSKIEIFNEDCMEGMKRYPDNHFDLAIVDPPYGIGVGGSKPFGGVGGSNLVEVRKYKLFDDSKIPDKTYFDLLFQKTKKQIIWGGNFFGDYLPSTSCMIVWNKDRTGNFADCELAWTSFKTAVRMFKYRWNGLLQENMTRKEERIHPTQKPASLYRWLLKNYAKEGDLILDTHLGSGSIAIACYDMGFDLVGFEIDKDYFEAALKRLHDHQAQGRLVFPTRPVSNIL